MAINSVLHTNAQSIDRVLGAGLPVLLVFWKEKSDSSRQLDPSLDRLAADYAGKALITKVNVSDEPALVKRFAVSQTPSIVFIKGGKVVATAVGAADEAPLRSWLDYLIQGGSKPSLPGGASEALSGAQATYTNGSPGHGNGAPQPQGSGSPVTLTDANFDKIIGRGTVLVDFWAPWCGPCRMVAPAVEQLASEFAGRATVGKLNVDENPAVAQRYGIMSIPALYVFKDGQVAERMVGAQPVGALRQTLSRHV